MPADFSFSNQTRITITIVEELSGTEECPSHGYRDLCVGLEGEMGWHRPPQRCPNLESPSGHHRSKERATHRWPRRQFIVVAMEIQVAVPLADKDPAIWERRPINALHRLKIIVVEPEKEFEAGS